jgi:16S rRNA (uracil1498-N3)-methyltransferase
VQRFFVDPDILRRSSVVLGGEQARQIRRVLRLGAGAAVVLLDNQGWAYDAILTGFEGEAAHFELGERHAAGGEPLTHLTLYQAVLKGEHFEWVLQKGTEVGISRFVPLLCERNVVSDEQAIAGKRARWQRIIQEAAEQSERARLPVLATPVRFADEVSRGVRQGSAAPANPPAGPTGGSPAGSSPAAGQETVRLIAWERLEDSEEREARLRAGLARCNLRAGMRIQVFVGPEGGFSPHEIELARQHGLLPVSLGPRILRAETAGIVAAAAILYELGEI